MRAAVVASFDAPPKYQDFPEPRSDEEDALVVEVLAAGLHPRVRSQADGSHYTSTDALPLVPGVDGVGRDPDGRLRYFVLPDTTLGSMAERTLIDPRRSVVLDDAADPVAVAAAMNPAMSSWVALRRRVAFAAGQSVLVLGATGNAGRMAVAVARRLGAARVVAAARDATKLSRSDADDTVVLDDAERLAALASDVDVVLDYLWGEPAAAAMAALIAARPDRGKPLAWIQIGAVAGPTAPIPSAALRAARLQVVGSGQGSVPTRDIVAELAALAGEIAAGTFAADARAVPLADVERAWGEAATTTRRIVLTP
jgi:NADPH:quinone reductase-like Zn-dependent oxidoreductase